jgi:hypothetical protein
METQRRQAAGQLGKLAAGLQRAWVVSDATQLGAAITPLNGLGLLSLSPGLDVSVSVLDGMRNEYLT